MLVKKITYTDFNGEERTETFYFNLTRSEIMELQIKYPGGYGKFIEETVESNNKPKLMEMFKDIIKRSYGEKSEDGRRLIKSDEIATAFMQTPAYDELFMELCTDPNAAIGFVNGVLPDFGNKEEKERAIQEAMDRVSTMTETALEG